MRYLIVLLTLFLFTACGDSKPNSETTLSAPVSPELNDSTKVPPSVPRI